MKYQLKINAGSDESILSCEIDTEEKPQQIAITVLTAIRDMDKPKRKRRSDAGTTKTP